MPSFQAIERGHAVSFQCNLNFQGNRGYVNTCMYVYDNSYININIRICDYVAYMNMQRARICSRRQQRSLVEHLHMLRRPIYLCPMKYRVNIGMGIVEIGFRSCYLAVTRSIHRTMKNSDLGYCLYFGKKVIAWCVHLHHRNSNIMCRHNSNGRYKPTRT